MPFLPVTTADGQVSGVDDLSSAASSVVNWEIDQAGVNAPRPPLIEHEVTGIGSSPFIGGERWGDYVVWVSADRYVRAISQAGPSAALVLSSSSTATQVPGISERVTFVSGSDYIYMAGGAQIQRWNSDLGLTEVMASSPACTHIASLGQYLIANDTSDKSIIRWSEIGEGAWTSWPEDNFTSAEARPDDVVGVYENTNELLVFGETTTQVYALGSDPTLPFDVVTTVNSGLAAPYAAARIESSFAVLNDQRQIVISDGRTVTPISDAIQKDIRDLSTISDCWMFHENRGQFSQLVVRFPTEALTFVYDLSGKRWTERDYYDSPVRADWPVGAYVYWPAYNYHMFGLSSEDGGLSRFATEPGAELDGPLVCERTTGWTDYGTANRKRSGLLRLSLRRGTGGSTPGALEVRMQTDSSAWSEWKQISVGTASEFQMVRDMSFSRVFRRCRYGFRFSTTEAFSLVGVQHDVEDLEREDA